MPVDPRVEHDCLQRESELGRFRGVPWNARMLACYSVVLHHLAGHDTSSEVVQCPLTGATLPNRCNAPTTSALLLYLARTCPLCARGAR